MTLHVLLSEVENVDVAHRIAPWKTKRSIVLGAHKTNPPGTHRQELSDNQIQSTMDEFPPRFKVQFDGSEDSPTGHPDELAMFVATSDEPYNRRHQNSTLDVDQFRATWQTANASGRATGCKKLRLDFCTPKRQDEFLSCLHDLVKKDTKTVVIRMGRKYQCWE